MNYELHDPLCPYRPDHTNDIWSICQCPLIEKVVEREQEGMLMSDKRSDDLPSLEGVLRYVSRYEPIAYFCDPDVTGDDWNDRPWEHNAELPYSYHTRIAYFDTYLETPGWNMLNSSWSVDDINKGAVAWLSGYDVHIPAGVTPEKFIELVEQAGGIAIVLPDRRVAGTASDLA